MSPSTQPPLPELLRPADMAALLSCSLAQIGVMRRRGNLPESFKMGRRRYWRREDIHAWLQARVTVAQVKEGGAA